MHTSCGSRGRAEMPLVVTEDRFPSAVVVLMELARLSALIPSAVLQFDASGVAVLGDESNFHLRSDVPTRRAPGESDDFRRLISRETADFVFGSVCARL